MKRCLKCDHQADGDPVECPACGAVYSKLDALAGSGQVIRTVRAATDEDREAARRRHRDAEGLKLRTTAELLERARTTGEWRGVDAAVVQQEHRAVLLVTTDFIPGRKVDGVCGIVSADFAYAFGAIFEEVVGFVRNVAGSGQSSDTVKLMRQGRAEVFHILRNEALSVGANAVVGVRIDYEEFSGANQRGILVVAATGTAVRLSLQGGSSQ